LNKLNLLLAVALLGSCFVLVRSAYEGRRLFAAVDRAKNEQQQLDTETKRLEAERQGRATHLRVEQVAREKLQMRTATAGVTEYVKDRPGSLPAAAAPGRPQPASAQTGGRP
jgi:cell division protein FtsL